MDGLGFVFLIFTAAIGFALFMLFAAGGMDRNRIQDYFRQRGEQLVELHWAPFGPGWFGEGNARIYQVRYRDAEGRTHSGHVKTSIWSGVYLTGDQVVCSHKKDALANEVKDPAQMTHDEIELEKARLRGRLAELDQMSERR